jgi:mannose-1-phosphate guanylyltransferase
LSGIRLASKAILLYEDFEKISLDYGVMEKKDDIKVIPMDVGWYDIGSYTAFEDIFDRDDSGNTIRDSHVQSVDCHGNIFLTENLEIKAVGLDNIIVVQSGNKLLLCDKYKMDLMKKFG